MGWRWVMLHPTSRERAVPTTHEIHEAAGVVVLKLSGEVDDQEVIRGIEQLRNDARLKREYALLVDVREQAPGMVSSEMVRSLASGPSLVSRSSRKAVLVSTDFGFGMTRMFNLNLGDDEHGYTIFREEAEARRFVGLDPA